MTIISIINNKGGTAKTTSTAAIGSILANKGFKTLLVELDEQCNLTRGLLHNVSGETIYDILRQASSSLPIYEIDKNLSMIPGSEKLNSIESEISGKVGGERILFKILKQIEKEFDFAIIDCPPAKNALVANALVSSNYVLIPAEPEPYAYKGALVISSLVDEIKEYYNPKLEVLGIFISKSNPRRTITKAIKDAIKKETGDLLFNTDIRIDVSIPESQAAEKTILQYNLESNAVKDYTELTNELLRKIKIYEEKSI